MPLRPRGQVLTGLAVSVQEQVVIEVVDTGQGISVDSMRTLFAQFSQGSDDDMAQPRQYSGTGLGLSICSRQVRLLLCVIA